MPVGRSKKPPAYDLDHLSPLAAVIEAWGDLGTEASNLRVTVWSRHPVLARSLERLWRTSRGLPDPAKDE